MFVDFVLMLTLNYLPKDEDVLRREEAGTGWIAASELGPMVECHGLKSRLLVNIKCRSSAQSEA